MGLGGNGLVVSVHAFNSGDLSSNPTTFFSFSVKMVEKVENKEKGAEKKTHKPTTGQMKRQN